MSSCKGPEILSIEMFKDICPADGSGAYNWEKYINLELNGKRQPIRVVFKGSEISGTLSIVTGIDLSAEKWFLNQNPKGLLMFPEYIDGGSIIARNLPSDCIQTAEDFIAVCLKTPHNGRIFLDDIQELKYNPRIFNNGESQVIMALSFLPEQFSRAGILKPCLQKAVS